MATNETSLPSKQFKVFLGKKIRTCLQKNISIFYVDSDVRLQRAVQVLNKQSIVAFDMEGLFSIKKSEGAISILQFATSNKKIYIIDVKKMGDIVFSSLYLGGILCSSNIIKLCYDARCDAKLLYFQKNLKVAGFYDLQIVFNFLFQSKSDPFLKGYHIALQRLLSQTLLMAKLQNNQSSPLTTQCGIEISLLQGFIQFKRNQKKKWNLDFQNIHSMVTSDQFFYSVLDVVFLFDLYLIGCEQTFFSNILDTTEKRIENFLQTICANQEREMYMAMVDF